MSNTAVSTPSVQAFFANMRARLEQVRNDVMEEAQAAMTQAMEEGRQVAVDRIEAAVTPTGERRAAAGLGHPGRVETESYRDDFRHQTERDGVDHAEGRFGWLDGGRPANADPRTIEELQDTGFQSVAGVHAMLEAAEVSKSSFKKRLSDYVRGELS